MKKVLIADDKPASRELIRAIVELLGHKVIEASDGIEALEYARQYDPDLVLLDLHMPALDGYGVTQALRRDPRFATVPILALTASAMHGDWERALAAGFTSYITKPISLKVLRAEIQQLLGKEGASG